MKEGDLNAVGEPGTRLRTHTVKRNFLALTLALAAWIVPGLGHLLLQRRWRALVFFISVAGLSIAGYRMRGQVFPPHSDDTFGTLGFFADVCTGVFYPLSRFFQAAGPDVSRASGDYGTRLIAAAGMVNFLSMLDAYRIASGRRS